MPERRDAVAEILRRRIIRGLHAGALVSGDRLPSARELQAELKTDHRVILDAYRDLAAEGLVELRKRSGAFVSAQPGIGGGIPALPEGWIVDVLAQGVSRELPIPELHDWLRRCVDTLRLRAVAIESTTDQIAGLCRELGDDYGLDASGVDIADFGRGDPPIEVRRADLLVTTAVWAPRVRQLAERLGKPCIVAEVRPDVIGAEWRLFLKQPCYVVVADEEFVDKLRKFFEGTPGVENLRPIVLGRDDLATIPDNAPTYITRGARENLGDAKLRGRILPPARLFSSTTARELIEFVVRANLEALSRRRA